VGFEQGADASDARAHEDAEAIAVLLRGVSPASSTAITAQATRVLQVEVQLALVLLVDVLERVEALHLAGDPRGEALGDRSGDAGPIPDLPWDERGPELLRGVADGCHRPQPGDDDPRPLHALTACA
jgi:hypothetical protein